MASQTYSNVTVGTTATLIAAANNGRRGLIITNNSSTTDIFYGPDASITKDNALPLYANQTLNLDKVPEGYGGSIYGITASGTADVRYWENSNVG
jgi:hypothetical protein